MLSLVGNLCLQNNTSSPSTASTSELQQLRCFGEMSKCPSSDQFLCRVCCRVQEKVTGSKEAHVTVVGHTSRFRYTRVQNAQYSDLRSTSVLICQHRAHNGEISSFAGGLASLLFRCRPSSRTQARRSSTATTIPFMDRGALMGVSYVFICLLLSIFRYL